MKFKHDYNISSMSFYRNTRCSLAVQSVSSKHILSTGILYHQLWEGQACIRREYFKFETPQPTTATGTHENEKPHDDSK
jgi:hypothetical protein